MRTATTVAVTHEGEDKLIFGLTEPLELQRQFFRKIRGERVHTEYAILQYQEKDTAAQTLKFRSPEGQKEHDEIREKETKEHADYLASLSTVGAQNKSAQEVKRAEQHKKDVAAHSENIAKSVEGQQLNDAEAATFKNARRNRGVSKVPAAPPVPPAKGSLGNPHLGEAIPEAAFGNEDEYFGNPKTSKLYRKAAGEWREVNQEDGSLVPKQP